MKIINKVTNSSYTQWVQKFVQDVLSCTDVSGNEVVIEAIDPDKRIFLTIDGEEYDIRTWSFNPVEKDKSGKTCAEIVEYAIYKMVNDNTGSHGEIVDEGRIKIEWKN